jgi:Na+/H+ antiporter NhaA
MSLPVSLPVIQSASRTSPRLENLRNFLQTEAGGAVVMLGAALAALVWANSVWRDAYFELWQTDVSFQAGAFALGMDLGHWVSDFLMAFFFLLIGLEIRREFDMGELRDRSRVAAPVLGAIGGMVVPALLFLAIARDPGAANGWAMVMATDTAFGLGILALVGRRAPIRYRVFLLTLMIVDDIGAIVVIGLFYSHDVSLVALAVAVGLLALMVVLRRIGIERTSVYWAIGVLVWYATLQAGIHPTVAGVAIGLITTAYPARREALQAATGLTRAFREQPSAELASAAARRIRLALSPNDRLQHTLHPWTSFVIVPLFALANAGVTLTPEAINGALVSPITWGIVIGLVGGKFVGINLGTWLATRRWLGGGPLPISWLGVVKISTVGGVGFTISLLIAQLAYTGAQLEEAKIGILAASGLAAVVAVATFQLAHLLPLELRQRAEAGTVAAIADLLVPVDAGRDHIRGPADAPVTLVQYGDYECPHCRSVAPVISQLLARYQSELRFAARHFPLPDVHPNAALAAEAAEAAAAQDRFWEMHDTLYRHGDALQMADLVRYATDIGLDAVRFEKELRAGRYSQRVARHVASGDSSGVTGTPTMFINELRYDGPYELEPMQVAIRAALATARLRAPAAEAAAA